MAADLSGLSGQVTIATDTAEAAQALTSWLTAVVTERVAATGRCTVALSGGSSPIALYDDWSTPARAEELQLRRWVVLAVDERAVPPEDPASNALLIRTHLLEPLGPDAPVFWPMEGGAADLDLAASRYAAQLIEVAGSSSSPLPELDVVLLGLGDDGHTASLFPQSEALEVTDRLVVPGRAPVAPQRRLTLTYPVLNAARHVAFYAPGASKAAAILATAAGSTPASRVRPRGELRWFLDADSARELPGS